MYRALPIVTYKGKHLITPGNVTVGNVPGMKADDQSWRALHEPWERLRWARIRWQKANGQPDNAKAAADTLGMKDGTYRAYERPPGSSKHTPLDLDAAEKFGRLFGVRPMWLLRGAGAPFISARSPDMARIISAIEQMSDSELRVTADMIEAFQRKPERSKRRAR